MADKKKEDIPPPASGRAGKAQPNDDATEQYFSTGGFEFDVNINKIKTLDQFFRTTQPIGSSLRAIGNNLYGINHRKVKAMIPENRDDYGLVFFTRPQLNLGIGNLRNIRKFYSLLTTKQNSVHRYVRCMLDPRLSRMHSGGVDIAKYGIFTPEEAAKGWNDDNVMKKLYEAYGQPTITCPLVDEKMAFIPILTNAIKSMSGWNDIVLPTYTSKEGLKREQWSVADGMIDIYDSTDLDCTFRNMKDEPLILLFETWLRYMALVFEGMISPYFDFIVENEIDYMTRIYRLVLDESKRFVKKIAATGAAFPITVPNGKFFDFEDSENYNNGNKDIQIRFKCIGQEYNDDILAYEFNQAVYIFNPELRHSGTRECEYTKIPFQYLELFNNRGYPLINLNTLELEWHISRSSRTYKEITSIYNITF